jgi:hypothetical protein
MPTATEGIWAPEEAEQAMIEFGNLFLQLVQLQRTYGFGPAFDPNTPAQAGETVIDYLQGLSNDRLARLMGMLHSLPTLTEAMTMLSEMELLRRAMRQP